MIILPDRSLSRGKLLMPIPKGEWRESSVSLARDQFNNKVIRTFFRLTARLADGHIAWRGQFEDRDDADAFLFALASGSLRYERELWRLPTPEWHPGLGENLSYEFATVTFLTSTSSATYTSPSDWNNSSNTIEGIGGGASGGVEIATSTNPNNSGGGGGEYREIANFTFASPGTTTASYVAGSGGTAVALTSSGFLTQGGNNGANTTFNSTSLIAVSGKGGTSSAAGAGGTGGTGAAGSANGGAGSFATGAGAASGGGGAGGPNGAGANSGAATSSNVASTGGNGGGGSGGAGGAGRTTTGTATSGGNGTEWQASPAYGSGGGGGAGAVLNANVTAGSGGTYGGGGGAVAIRSMSASRTGTSGAGAQGLIVVTYTPVALISLANNNLPMLGM